MTDSFLSKAGSSHVEIVVAASLQQRKLTQVPTPLYVDQKIYDVGQQKCNLKVTLCSTCSVFFHKFFFCFDSHHIILKTENMKLMKNFILSCLKRRKFPFSIMVPKGNYLNKLDPEKTNKRELRLLDSMN